MDLHERLTFGNATRTHQGAKGPPQKRPTLPTFHVEISLREMRESFVEAPPCHIPGKKKENRTPKPWSNLPQDLDDTDIIGGSNLHIGIDKSLNSTNNFKGF